MGTAFIEATMDEALELALGWARDVGFKVGREFAIYQTRDGERISERKGVKVRRIGVVAKWEFDSEAGGTVVRLFVRPPLYVTLPILVLEYAGLAYAVYGIHHFSQETRATDFLKLGIGVAVAAVMLSLASRLLRMVRHLENIFWEKAQDTYRVRLPGRADPLLVPRWVALPCVVLLSMLALWAGAFLGIGGFAFILLLIAPTSLASVLKFQRGKIAQWPWRIWLVENMSKWTSLMASVLVMVFLLTLTEGALVELGKNGYKHPGNPRDWWGHYREVSLHTAVALESDAKRRMREWGDASIPDIENVKKEFTAFLRRIWPTVLSVSFLALVVALILLLWNHFLLGLLKSAGDWRQEVGERGWRTGPFVLPVREKQTMAARAATAVIALHYAFGGLLNLAAAAFGFEGLAYLVAGRTLLRPENAHLWSWVFAWSDIVIDSKWGHLLAGAIVIVTAFPLMICTGTLVWRFTGLLRGWATRLKQEICHHPLSPVDLSSLQDFIKDSCSRLGIRCPLLRLATGSTAGVRTRWLPLSARTVIEIGRETAALLDSAEIKAAVAHELGHVKQGLASVAMLKVLSLLALFPNYYLTACLDWYARELDADRFALKLLGNPVALRAALIKVSMASMSEVKESGAVKLAKKVGSWPGGEDLVRSIEELVVAVRFFFGDAILGYSHPLLADRLAAVDAFEKARASLGGFQ
jgi:hypothetical protein